ncbi:MAG: hypothetical protein ACOCZ6_06105 [Nanoarchaeota archaeon]
MAVDNIIENAKRHEKEKIAQLEAKAKPLHKLVEEETFIVEDVTGQSYARQITPVTEAGVGVSSPRYQAGYSFELVLEVSPEDKDLPINTLSFKGYSPVKKGEYITAKIPRFYKEEVKSGLFAPHKSDLTFYLDRQYNSIEYAIEISVLSDTGDVLRRERAVDYNDYIKS